MSSTIGSQPSPTRLVLFDIDGTLLTSAGLAGRIFTDILAEVVGRPVALDGYSMAGKTDPRIVRDLLERAGLEATRIDETIAAVLDRYVERFAPVIAASPRPRLFPGIRELVTRLADNPQVVLGLLTGNIERGAVLKLERFGLRRFFRLGAYGSDSEDRRALVKVAVERAAALTGRRFEGRDVVVIGDTPRDIDCGRAAGAFTVAVGTGPIPVSELAAHEPDVLFEDFSDVDSVVEAILGNPLVDGGSGGVPTRRGRPRGGAS
jgi:phosphoglycolate phosphatase-like HAD superfamily hydrolase